MLNGASNTESVVVVVAGLPKEKSSTKEPEWEKSCTGSLAQPVTVIKNYEMKTMLILVTEQLELRFKLFYVASQLLDGVF